MGETPAYHLSVSFAFPTGILGFVSVCFLAGVLSYVSYTDLRWRIVSDKALACAGLWWAFAWTADALACGFGFPEAIARLVPGFAGATFLGALSLATALAMDRILGKESLGGGDVKLLAAIGLYLGPEGGVAALFVACMLTVLFGVACMLLEKERGEGLPFAPFLSVGFVLCLFA